jgi:Ulp1 family protease
MTVATEVLDRANAICDRDIEQCILTEHMPGVHQSVRPEDISTCIEADGWLTESHIDVYCHNIQERSNNACVSVSSHLREWWVDSLTLEDDEVMIASNKYDVLKETLLLNVDTVNKLIIPIHFKPLPYHIAVQQGRYLPEHWAMIVADIETSTLTYYDSLASTRESESEYQLLRVCSFIDQLWISVNRETIVWNRQTAETPLQRDGSSCGVFALAHAENACKAPAMRLPFAQPDAMAMRWRILHYMLE